MMVRNEDLAKVRVYAYRTVSGFGGHFGWGLTPKMAYEMARSAGAKGKELKTGEMLAFPDGTVYYGIDGMGCLYARRETGDERKLQPFVKMVKDDTIPEGWKEP